MGIREDIINETSSFLILPWNVTEGRKIPSTESLGLGTRNGTSIQATFLYSDLAESSFLGQNLPQTDAAGIVKAFLYSSSAAIKWQEGEIKSFDGDRVMGVFYGANKEERAIRAAFAIIWAVASWISPLAGYFSQWPEEKKAIRHATGIATGDALFIRGGVRNDNDLVSIGAAPNVAAKLSEIRDRAESTFIDDYTWMHSFGDTWKDELGKSLWTDSQFLNIGGNVTSFRGSAVAREPEKDE
ncbi:hypothetical protein AS850_15005 [Frondihabitans sp. 762G35]|nr:hypothetical protein AS850_15005 [Frondihabitans sp. 762G35]